MQKEISVMDKIMSTRMDESVIQSINILAKTMGTSKKAVLEKAVKCLAESIAAEKDLDIFVQTSGGWDRDESNADTVRSTREAMRMSQERYKR
jgi:hypothetical protein